MNQTSSAQWTETELQAIKKMFNQLAPMACDGILVHNKIKILQVDPQLADIFGYPPPELVGQTLLALSIPEGRDIIMKNTLLGSERPYIVIGQLRDKGSAHIPLEFFSRSLTYQGRSLQVTGVRKIVEQSLDSAREALHQAKQELETAKRSGSTTQLRYSNERLRLELDERVQMETQLRDRAQQQAAVAELGQRALVGTDLDLLMEEAVSLAAQTLRVEYTKIQELTSDSNHIRVKAGVGWRNDTAARAVAKVNNDSQAGYTLFSSGPVIVEDLAAETRFKPSTLLQEHGVVSGMSVIIYGREKPFGVLGAHTTSMRNFTEDDVHFLQAVANVLGTAIENTRLHQETLKRAEQLAVLNELDRAITTSLRLSDIYHAFTQYANRLVPYDCTSITLLENNQIRVSYTLEEKDQTIFPPDATIPREGSAIGWVVEERQPLLRHDISREILFAEDERLIAGGIRSSMIMPLRVKGQVLGTWNIGSKQVGTYTPDDLEVTQLMADQLAIALENARLFQKARQEITERQRAEKELAQERAMLTERVAERTMDLMAANEELARAARLKDEFLASMSHELRTPLTAVLGMAEILKMEAYGPLTEQQSKSIDVIDESGRHLLALINDILDLSKIEADKLDLEFDLAPVQTVCQSSLQFIKQTAAKKEIEVSFEQDPAVTVIEADERRFKQILVNLLSNAVKFTPDGGQVGLEVTGDPEEQQIHFSVWDTGIGIAPEDRERLFQPFVQLDSKLARQYSGTGLGLALVHRMTQLHQGSLSLESEPGQGSRFTVSFPWPADPSAPTAQAPAATDQQKTDALTDPIIENVIPERIFAKDDQNDPPARPNARRVLLAEDEYTTILLVTDYLKLVGYEVISAENGVEALERAKAEHPHIILMDIQMPKMDGVDVIRHLRADETMKDVPIIALTALAMPGDREKCLAAGANDYISKPIDLSKLARAIEKQLASGSTNEEPL